MKNDDKNRGALKNLALISQIGISMITPIFLGMFIGGWIDKRAKTQGVFMIIFMVFGIGAGFMNVLKITGAFKDKRK